MSDLKCPACGFTERPPLFRDGAYCYDPWHAPSPPPSPLGGPKVVTLWRDCFGLFSPCVFVPPAKVDDEYRALPASDFDAMQRRLEAAEALLDKAAKVCGDPWTYAAIRLDIQREIEAHLAASAPTGPAPGTVEK